MERYVVRSGGGGKGGVVMVYAGVVLRFDNLQFNHHRVPFPIIRYNCRGADILCRFRVVCLVLSDIKEC